MTPTPPEDAVASDAVAAASGTWNYRVIATPHAPKSDNYGPVEYGIHEVYYDADGRITGWTEQGVAPGGDSWDDLDDDLSHMVRALSLPTLDADALPLGSVLVPVENDAPDAPLSAPSTQSLVNNGFDKTCNHQGCAGPCDHPSASSHPSRSDDPAQAGGR